MRFRFLLITAAAALTLLSSCDDQGDPVSSQTPSAPLVNRLNPSAAVVGDTIEIIGSNFGSTQGANKVTLGADSVTTISWNTTQIKIIIPISTTPGTPNLQVKVNGQTSNAKPFQVITINEIKHYTTDVIPIFNSKGCTGCHGGSGGLTVAPHSSLLAGNSANGPVIIPGDGESSVLVKKLRGTAGFGGRMPLGGSALDAADIQRIVDWINQGAKNN